MKDFRNTVFIIFLAFLIISCDAVNSQVANGEKPNSNAIANTEKPETNSDDYESSKTAAEELNKTALPKMNSEILNKTFSREQIRKALIANNLTGESANGEVGGYKIVHFSHVCNLSVENKAFFVVKMDSILQNASFARADSRTLIFDESAKLVQNLSAATPLFCEGNRLFFNDYKMTVFYGEPEKQIKGNVLFFSNGAKNIEAKAVNLNFYKFKDLIH